MVTKVVRKDKSAEAVKANKKAKQYRQKNKGKLNAKARKTYATMKPKDKLKHLERQVFTKAMRHGATEAEADKAVKAYKLRRRQRAAGKHASAKIGAARNTQREVRNNIRQQAAQVRDAHRAALAKIKSAGGTPAQRSKMRQAEKKRYANDRSKLASMRKKAVGKHKTLLTNIKKKAKPFRLQDFISNYSKTPISRKGKRLKTIDPTAAISNKHFGGGAKKKTRGNTTTKTAGKKGLKSTPSKGAVASMNGSATPHGVKKDGTPAAKRGRKPKAAVVPAEAAPAKRGRGRPKKVVEAAAPAAPAAKKRGRPAGSKNKAKEAAPAPAAVAPKKRGRPAKAKPAETAAAPAPKKRGRPAGSKNKPKEAAAPVKAAAAKAAKAPAKKAAEKAAKPAAKAAATKAAKAPAKAAAKAAAKPAAKAAAKPVAKKEAAKVAAKVATKVATKAAAKSKGGAVPKKSSNRKAALS